jgi:hypothetical protein
MTSFVCKIKGHEYRQCLPAIKPPRWTHSLYCVRCGNSVTFCDPAPPAAISDYETKDFAAARNPK